MVNLPQVMLFRKSKYHLLNLQVCGGINGLLEYEVLISRWRFGIAFNHLEAVQQEVLIKKYLHSGPIQLVSMFAKPFVFN